MNRVRPRVSSRKRKNEIMEYEIPEYIIKLNSKEHYYYIEKYDKHFSINELILLNECVIDRGCLFKRILNLKNRMGKIKNIMEAITTPLFISKETEVSKRYKMNMSKKEIKDEEYNDFFNNCMKLMKPGSLAKESRIIQSYEIGK